MYVVALDFPPISFTQIAMKLDVVSELIDLIYQAALDPGKWSVFLEHFAEVVDGHAANLSYVEAGTPAPQIAATARWPPEAILEYNAYYGARDPWGIAGRREGLFWPGYVGFGEEVVLGSDLKKTEFYNDYGRRVGLTGGLSGCLRQDGPAISVISVSNRPGRALRNDAIKLTGILVPHLQRALEVHRRVAGAEIAMLAFTDVLARLSQGVILLSANGTVQFVNRAGEDILNSKDGLELESGELRTATVSGTARLASALRNAARISAGELIHGDTALLSERPSGKRPLLVLAASLPKHHAMLGIEAAAVVVFVTDQEHPPKTEKATLQAMFGLTRAEAQLVLVLLEGASVQQAAERLELATDTVRKRLKVIFQKTDTHRQADLIRHVLLSTLPRNV